MHPLLERVRESGSPVIDDGHVTFVWEGDETPFLVGDFNGWNPAQGKNWTGRADGLWTQEYDFPLEAYLEYAYLTEPRDEARTPDPWNDRSVANGVGQHNHFFAMPGRPANPLIDRERGAPQGELTRRRIENSWLLAGGKRWLHLYRPVTQEPTPLLVIYDAQDYLTRGRITQIVDNLIHQKRIRPISLAAIDNGGPARGFEYMANDATVGLVMNEILPLARANMNLTDPSVEPYGVMGASMGGLMATYTGLRAPQVFRKVLSQSGAFEMGDGDVVTTPLVRYLPVAPLKIWMDAGKFEWLLEPNRRFHALLQARGYDVTYREYEAGHNYSAWRDDCWRGLEALFGV